MENSTLILLTFARYDEVGPWDRNALHWSCLTGQIEMSKWLIMNGVSVRRSFEIILEILSQKLGSYHEIILEVLWQHCS
jgi:hypothetical protein